MGISIIKYKGSKSLIQDLKSIRLKLSKENIPTIDKLIDCIETADEKFDIVPPLVSDLPLSYRSGDTLPGYGTSWDTTELSYETQNNTEPSRFESSQKSAPNLTSENNQHRKNFDGQLKTQNNSDQYMKTNYPDKSRMSSNKLQRHPSERYRQEFSETTTISRQNIPNSGQSYNSDIRNISEQYDPNLRGRYEMEAISRENVTKSGQSYSSDIRHLSEQHDPKMKSRYELETISRETITKSGQTYNSNIPHLSEQYHPNSKRRYEIEATSRENITKSTQLHSLDDQNLEFCSTEQYPKTTDQYDTESISKGTTTKSGQTYSSDIRNPTEPYNQKMKAHSETGTILREYVSKSGNLYGSDNPNFQFSSTEQYNPKTKDRYEAESILKENTTEPGASYDSVIRNLTEQNDPKTKGYHQSETILREHNVKSGHPNCTDNPYSEFTPTEQLKLSTNGHNEPKTNPNKNITESSKKTKSTFYYSDSKLDSQKNAFNGLRSVSDGKLQDLRKDTQKSSILKNGSKFTSRNFQPSEVPKIVLNDAGLVRKSASLDRQIRFQDLTAGDQRSQSQTAVVYDRKSKMLSSQSGTGDYFSQNLSRENYSSENTETQATTERRLALHLSNLYNTH